MRTGTCICFSSWSPALIRASHVSIDACSLVATLFEGQCSALPTSAHSRKDDSLTGQGTDSVVAVSREHVAVLWCRACKHYTCAARKPDLRPNERLFQGQSGDF